ncbi:hypothetical protein JCM17380_39850 [Desulfosporosinus burensis]
MDACLNSTCSRCPRWSKDLVYGRKFEIADSITYIYMHCQVEVMAVKPSSVQDLQIICK